MRRTSQVALIASAGVLIAVGAYAAGYASGPSSPAHALPRSADEWVALGTWAAVGIATVAALVGLRQAHEARQLRIEQAQAYVVAYIEQNPHNVQVIELVIKNVGVTAAKDVRIAVDRPLRGTSNESGKTNDVWVPTAIPFLAPGQEWRTVWDFARERLQHPVLQAEDCHEMTVRYLGVEQAGEQVTRAVLDWGPFKGRTYMDVRTIHHGAKALQEIQKAVGRWSEGGARRGLAVNVRDGDAYDTRLRERRDAWRAAQAPGEAVDDEPRAPEAPDLTGDADAPRETE